MGVEFFDATGALVGVISETGYNWSTVLTTVDTDTSLGARVFRTKELGLAQGDFSQPFDLVHDETEMGSMSPSIDCWLENVLCMYI